MVSPQIFFRVSAFQNPTIYDIQAFWSLLLPHTLFQKPSRTFAGWLWSWIRFVGTFSAFLTFWRVAPQPHGPSAPERPGNHSTFAPPCACAVIMPQLQPFQPSARARLEAIKDKTLSPVKATLEEAPRDSDPPHSADWDDMMPLRWDWSQETLRPGLGTTKSRYQNEQVRK